MYEKTITFNANEKFDLQLSQALIRERRLGDVFQYGRIEKWELKSESWLWEKSGNICIEYKRDGKPSGLSVTEADYWAHELLRNNETLAYFMFPVPRLKDECRLAIRAGRFRIKAGDGGRQHVVLLRLRDLLR